MSKEKYNEDKKQEYNNAATNLGNTLKSLDQSISNCNEILRNINSTNQDFYTHNTASAFGKDVDVFFQKSISIASSLNSMMTDIKMIREEFSKKIERANDLKEQYSK